MKKTWITTIAIASLALIGASPKAAAGGFVSGYVQVGGYRSCEVPTFTERYVIGYDAWGNPVWGYRTVCAPRYVAPVCPPARICVPPPVVVRPHHHHHGDWYGPYYRR